MMTFFLWLRGLAFVAKLLSIAGPVMAFVPGGQIVAGVATVAGAVLKAVGRFVRWAWDGVAVCFSHPSAFIVCVAFMLFGAWSYSAYHRDLVRDLRDELAITKKQRDTASNLLAGWKQRYAEEDKRAKEAEAARDAAVAARKQAELERDRRMADVAAAQPGTDGVRAPAAAGRARAPSRPAQPAEPSLFKGLFTYPAGPGR